MQQNGVIIATNATRSKSVQNLDDSGAGELDTTTAKSRQIAHDANHGALRGSPDSLEVLKSVAKTLRPLGPHPALVAILRRMARVWVRRWVDSTTLSMHQTSAVQVVNSGPKTEDMGNTTDETKPAVSASLTASASASVEHPRQPLSFLRNAAACLAEARRLLSNIVASAEPVQDVLSVSPVIALKNTQRGGGAEGERGAQSNTVPIKEGKKKDAGRGPDKPNASRRASKGGLSSEVDEVVAESSKTSFMPPSRQQPAAVSTPIGRVLVMVQLEEACVRAMLGRAKGELQSEEKTKGATVNDKGATPVQR